jgi:hypothetical protein
MPRLNLLSEENLNLRSILLSDQWEDRGIDCVEHLLRERADIVQVELQGVQSLCILKASELLSSELGCESHVGFLKILYLGFWKVIWALTVEYKGR